MLVSGVRIDTGPVPAYGTTRYSGAIDFKENVNEYFLTSPRNAYVGSRLLCSRTDKRPKEASIRRTIENRNVVLQNSAESSTVSVCANTSAVEAHCTCDEIEPNEDLCTCFENGQTDSETTCQLSTTNWKELYKLTDTSETKLANSFEDLFNCATENGILNKFLDVYESHPRRERGHVKGKDLPPSGYDVALILPQCVCLKILITFLACVLYFRYKQTDFQECKKVNESKSDESFSDGKSDTISDLICMPSVAELSWDVLQSGAIEKIPEKYTTNIFEAKKVESEDVGCFKTQENVCKETDSRVTYCLHKVFLENLNKSYFSM